MASLVALGEHRLGVLIGQRKKRPPTIPNKLSRFITVHLASIRPRDSARASEQTSPQVARRQVGLPRDQAAATGRRVYTVQQINPPFLHTPAGPKKFKAQSASQAGTKHVTAGSASDKPNHKVDT